MASYMRERRSAARELAIPLLSPARYSARRRLEKHPARWLRHYWPQVYFQPFSSAHRAIMDKTRVAFREGGRYAVAMRRGGVIEAVDAYTRCHMIHPWYVTREDLPTAFWVRQ